MSLGLLDTVGAVSTEITLDSAKEELGASFAHAASKIEIAVREKAGQVLQKASDKLNSVKQVSQQVAQRVSKLTPASEWVTTTTQTVDNLKSTNQTAIDEQIEQGAWATIEKTFWGTVRKKGTATTIAAKTTSALSSLLDPSQVCTGSRDGETSMFQRLRSKLPTLSMPSLSMPTLSAPTLSMPSMSIPKLTLPSVSLPKLTMPSLSMPTLPSFLNFSSKPSTSTTKFSWPTLPEIHLPTLEAIPNLSDIVTHEYVQKGIEKGIEIVIDKGVEKGYNRLQQAVEGPMHETMKQTKGQIEPKLQQCVGEETTECMEAASTIAHYRTAECATRIKDCVQTIKGKITSGLRAASHWLCNSCCSTTLPATV